MWPPLACYSTHHECCSSMLMNENRKTIAGASVFALFKGKEALVISKQLCCSKVVDNFIIIEV